MSGMAKSVLELAKQCMVHGAQLLPPAQGQQQAGEEEEGPSGLQAAQKKTPKQRKKLQAQAERLRGIQLAMWGENGRGVIRGLMYAVTDFLSATFDCWVNTKSCQAVDGVCRKQEWAAATEALIRTQQTPLTKTEVVQAARVSWDFLAHISRVDDSADVPTLSTGLSLATTMRKLLLTVVPCETDKAARARPQLWADHPPQKTAWGADRAALVDFADALEPILVGALSALNSLHRPTSGKRGRVPGACSSFVISSGSVGGGGAGGGGGVLVHNSSSSDGNIWVGLAGGGSSGNTTPTGGTFMERVMGRMGLGAVPPGGTADLNSVQVDTRGCSQAVVGEPAGSAKNAETDGGSVVDGDGSSMAVGDRGVTPDTPELVARRLVVHQLQALLCLTLTQLYRWRLECPGILHKMARIGEALQAVAQLPFVSLRDIVRPLLEEDSLAVSQSEVNAAWEAYAGAHFDGRLLPGCCHLACDGLGGPCEAAVEVLLCSGCRKARYCCKVCQKAAWKDGGHSTACGK